MGLVELLCLLSLLRLVVLGVWRAFFACKSGKSAFYGEFAVPAVPCESNVSAVPRRVFCVADGMLFSSCTDRFGDNWPSSIPRETSQFPSRMRVLAIGLIVHLDDCIELVMGRKSCCRPQLGVHSSS